MHIINNIAPSPFWVVLMSRAFAYDDRAYKLKFQSVYIYAIVLKLLASRFKLKISPVRNML